MSSLNRYTAALMERDTFQIWSDFAGDQDDLTAVEKKLFIRQANVYAAYLAYTDHADSDDVGRAFRLMSATCSDRSRPAVPIDVGRGGGAPAGRM